MWSWICYLVALILCVLSFFGVGSPSGEHGLVTAGIACIALGLLLSGGLPRRAVTPVLLTVALVLGACTTAPAAPQGSAAAEQIARLADQLLAARLDAIDAREAAAIEVLQVLSESNVDERGEPCSVFCDEDARPVILAHDEMRATAVADVEATRAAALRALHGQ